MAGKSYAAQLAAFSKSQAAAQALANRNRAKAAAAAAVPVVPKPAPVAPPVPTVSSSGALPIDLQVGVDTTRQIGAANYANQSAAIDGGLDRAASDYGFKVDYSLGPEGGRTVNSLAVDPSNPYSRAAALQRSYDQSKAGATNSLASRGQLYSGALQNAQNENTRAFGEGDNSLRQGFLDFYARQESARKQAGTDASNANLSAQAAAIAAAAARPAVDPGVVTPAGNTLPLPGSSPAQNPGFAAEWKASLAAQVAAQVAADKKKPKKRKP